MDVAAFVVAVVAALISGLAVWYARGQKKAADRAATEARRSADAAEEATGFKRAEVERNRVVFRLDPVRGNQHVLSNAGTDTAYGVHVDLRALYVRGDPGRCEFDEFPSGYAERYPLAGDGRTRATHIGVTWHHEPDRSDEPQSQELYVDW